MSSYFFPSEWPHVSDSLALHTQLETFRPVRPKLPAASDATVLTVRAYRRILRWQARARTSFFRQ